MNSQRAISNSVLTGALIGLLAFGGCQSDQVAETDYSHQLGPGECALKLVDSANWPDVAYAWRERGKALDNSLDQSIKWFGAPSSERPYPHFTVSTHEQAAASVVAFKDLIASSGTESDFVASLNQMFDCYQTVGYNGKGVVLFTGYYAPEFPASRERSEKFQYPLYKRPADLATDPVNGDPLGRRLSDGTTTPWPSRAELERTMPFTGTELVWLGSALDVYIIQVNGSAKLRMPDGKAMYVGYAGKTDGAYVGLGDSLVSEGIIKETELGLPAIRAYYQKDPRKIQELISRNNCYVFFTEYDGLNWPAGSLGVRVTDRETLATDKKVYPPGGVVLVDTQGISVNNSKTTFRRFMLDQDTGGAIRAPGRADIFMGVGSGAEILAGSQYAEGTLYYFFLKPEYVSQYPLPKKVDSKKGKEKKLLEPVA